MSNIASLQEQIDRTAALLEQYGDPKQNPKRRLTISSLRAHLSELQADLRREKQLRSKEVVSLRISGAWANGTIPLEFLGQLAKHFATTVQQASRFIKTGTHGGPIPSTIRSEVDLRLAGLSAGSTKIFVTGNTAPDIFGRSLLEESLASTFSILNAETPEALIDNASTIGKASVEGLRKMLQGLADENIAIEMEWYEPRGASVKWSANQERILSIETSLARVIAETGKTLEVVGETYELSLQGRIKLRLDDGMILTAIVPTQLAEKVEGFHLRQRVTARIHRETMKNEVTGYTKVSNSLTAIDIV